jgi:hypothetical protein
MTTNETNQDKKPSQKATARKLADDAVRKSLGWQRTMFCEARFDAVRKALRPANQNKWDRLSYARKCVVVMDFVWKGYMI